MASILLLAISCAVVMETVTGQSPLMKCPDVKGMRGRCIETCSEEDPSTCSIGLMCCSNGCGHTCQVPVSAKLDSSIPCPMCSEPCEFGFIHGTDGCPNCECSEDPCLVNVCPPGESCKAVFPTNGSFYTFATCIEGQPPSNNVNKVDSLPIPCPVCSEQCEFGFIMRKDGCPNCKCAEDPCLEHDCSEGEMCKAILPKGSFYSHRECVKGTDAPPSSIGKPMPCPICSEPCEFGYLKGVEGCPHCECARNPCLDRLCPPGKICESILPEGEFYAFAECREDQSPRNVNMSVPCPMCSEPCEFGFMPGTDGCPNCECAEDPCLDHHCPADGMCTPVLPVGSFYAFAECSEAPPFPPPENINMSVPCPMCSEPCEFGFIPGTDGCPNCECAEDPCLTHKCPAGNMCKATLQEGLFYAFVECHEGPEPENIEVAKPCPVCNETCEFGYLAQKDGCPKCECAEDPCLSHKCPTGKICIGTLPGNSFYAIASCLESPPLPPPLPDYINMSTPCPMCSETCEFGFMPESDGCPNCECAEDPCLNHSCPEGESCKAVFANDALYTSAECIDAPNEQATRGTGMLLIADMITIMFTTVAAVAIML